MRIAIKYTTRNLVRIGTFGKIRTKLFTTKRYNNLFEKIVDIENLRLAHQNARKGKTYYSHVQLVDNNQEYYLHELRESLINHTFTTSKYTTKEIYEPKQRTIFKLPYYPDRIIHHAIMNILQPIWNKTFIYDLYSAIPGKGLHAGSYRLRKFLRNSQDTKYCLKFDISKFYPSIDQSILLTQIKRKIKCKNTLWLLENIIRSPDGNKNVPIGNYLSQYFSNIYLNDFDHWLKEEKNIKYYIRYCDDGVILHQDKKFLKALKLEIDNYFTSKLKLSLNPKTQIIDVDKSGIDFLGYRHFRKYTLLRKSSARKYKNRIKDIENDKTKDPQKIVSSIMSSYGWLKHCDAYNLLSCSIFQNPKILEKVEQSSLILKIKNPLRNYMVESTIRPDEIQIRKVENGVAKLLCRWNITKRILEKEENLDPQTIYSYEETKISWILPNIFVSGSEEIQITSINEVKSYINANQEEILSFAKAKKNLTF